MAFFLTTNMLLCLGFEKYYDRHHAPLSIPLTHLEQKTLAIQIRFNSSIGEAPPSMYSKTATPRASGNTTMESTIPYSIIDPFDCLREESSKMMRWSADCQKGKFNGRIIIDIDEYQKIARECRTEAPAMMWKIENCMAIRQQARADQARVPAPAPEPVLVAEAFILGVVFAFIVMRMLRPWRIHVVVSQVERTGSEAVREVGE